MSLKGIFIIIFSCFFLLGYSCGKKTEQKKQLKEFSLSDVELTDSPFKYAMDLDKKWLLSFDPDKFLSGFRSEAGLTPKATKYGGWESQGVAGQTFGHYLSALAQMYAATKDEALNLKIKYSINELDSCQLAFGNGLIAGFPRAKELFAEIKKGDIRTEGFDLNGGWVPLYNMHKLFAGLIDVYRYTENEQAYKVLIALANGFYDMFSNLSDEQIQKILICEHGGINESMADMYAITKDEKYLKLAHKLNHKAIIDPLVVRKDELVGKHANTQIPKIVGVIRQHELMPNDSLYRVADFFWNTVVRHHSYVIGGNSEAEHFGVPDRTYDRITDKTCENCNTYNMLKLTKHLYQLNPTPEQTDYYERALYNQILASQNPNDGMVCYMSPLSAGSARWFSTRFDSFWCCVGTGLENHAQYGRFIYFRDNADTELYVNLFIPSILTWKERGITLKQETKFPEEEVTRLLFEMEKPQTFALKLRVPSWIAEEATVLINGESVSQLTKKDGYIELKREWKNGDSITYGLPMAINSESALGDDRLRAFLYGPIVLAGIVDSNTYPVVVGDVDKPQELITKKADSLHFTLSGGKPSTMHLIPYYKTVDKKMMVYFQHYTADEWTKNSETILMKQNQEQWIKDQTISQFSPGEMQPERDHHFKGENLEVGEIEGRKYRKAIDGGWFSFDMEIKPNIPQDLVCTYWGNLGDIYKFEVLVDNISVSTVIIHWWGNQFMKKTYHIPNEITQNKEKVTVTFKAIDKKSVAGPLFDCKILKN